MLRPAELPDWLNRNYISQKPISKEFPRTQTDQNKQPRQFRLTQTVKPSQFAVETIRKHTHKNLTKIYLYWLQNYGLTASPKDIPANLVLTGDAGLGKTSISFELANRAKITQKSDYKVQDFYGNIVPVWNSCKLFTEFKNWSEILRGIKANKFMDKDRVINTLKSVDFLVIDDLGSEMNTKDDGFDANVLWEVLDYRIWQNENFRNKRTIITTNLNLEELTDKYRRNIVDRLKHSKRIKWIKFLGGSQR